jgi:hypothetical protein
MKKAVLFCLLLLPFLAFAQETYTYKRGGRIFENNVKLTSTQIESYFGSNEKIMSLYNSGRAKKTTGNVLLYVGLSTLILKHINTINESRLELDSNGSPTFKRTSPTLYFVGGGLAILSIPIKMGYTKRIKKAVNLMNEEIKNQRTSSNIQATSFLVNSNGIGISIVF